MQRNKVSRELAKVKLHRRVLRCERTFLDIFEGFDRIPAVRAIFGDKTRNTLSKLLVAPVKGAGYMWVDQYNIRIMLSVEYLEDAPKLDLYLDAIHELVHIQQRLDGKNLFDTKYKYVDRPTEIEAYRAAAQEAHRLGMGREEIKEYLRVFWMTDGDLNRLYKRMHLPR